MSGDTSSAAFDAVLQYVADGDSLVSACRRPGMPSKSSVLRRVRSDAGFAKSYTNALEERAQIRLDRFGAILDKIEKGSIDPQSARVLLDGIKLQMQLDDRRLSERQRTELSGPNETPLVQAPTPLSDFEMARLLSYLLHRGAKEKDGGALVSLPTPSWERGQ
jgi:hypothetical protein